MKNLIIKAMAFVLLFAITVMPVTANYKDVEGHKYQEAISILTALEVVMGDGFEFHPDDFMTRAEFVRFSLNLLGMTQEGRGNAQTKFADVPYEHWASGAIALALEKGFINGTSETTFEPDNTIKFEQAVKIIICILGYDAQIADKSNYPYAYLNLASSLEITADFDLVVDDDVTRGEVCALLLSALNTPLMNSESDSDAPSESDVSSVPTDEPSASTENIPDISSGESESSSDNNSVNDHDKASKSITVNDRLVLDNCRQILDENEDIRYKISFWYEGELYDAICKDTITVEGFDSDEKKGVSISMSELRRGNVISIIQNIKNEVTNIVRYAPPNNADLFHDIPAYLIGTQYGNENVFGLLLGDIKNNRFEVGSGHGGNAPVYDYRINNDTYIYRYLQNGNSLKLTDKSDIYTDLDTKTYIYVHSKDGVPKFVVIYRY